MSKDNNCMEPQPKQQSLRQALAIRQKLKGLEGKALGSGFILNSGHLISQFNSDSSPYVLDKDGNPATFFHYRNLSACPQPGSVDFHDLMHFGTLRAAYSRAFSRRIIHSGYQFSEELLSTEAFNKCARLPAQNRGDFSAEVLLAARIKAKNPFFIPDIGQSHYFRNRTVLYACGLFDEAEVDGLFDNEDFPVEDIDRMVTARLRERGCDSIGYTNNIEDPGSLSLIILDRRQAEKVTIESVNSPGVRYRFGPLGETKIVEYDGKGGMKITVDPTDYGINGML